MPTDQELDRYPEEVRTLALRDARGGAWGQSTTTSIQPSERWRVVSAAVTELSGEVVHD
ncbi:MAG: hypothetical protein M3Q75_15960 [Gemmatimonadota bacterium]|nr:hypothetical protein [Gemmatimonadota bacterium]